MPNDATARSAVFNPRFLHASFPAFFNARIMPGGRNYEPTPKLLILTLSLNFNTSDRLTPKLRPDLETLPSHRNSDPTSNSTPATDYLKSKYSAQTSITPKLSSEAEPLHQRRNFDYAHIHAFEPVVLPKPRSKAETLLQVPIPLWLQFSSSSTQFKSTIPCFKFKLDSGISNYLITSSATSKAPGRPKLCSNAEFNQARPFRGPQTLHQVLIHAEFLRGCHFDFELGNSTTHVIPGTRRPVDQLQVQSSIELFFRTLLYACLSASFDLFLGFNHAQIRQLRILTQHSTSTPF
ncbi:hypothetical protein B0H16DRAFT_1466510 [Mycena metata]|uniref:Uncharacterized protein n=1 Tax=Mycena metata TaxID=1033252 RepID=A0AAD7I7P7_9AGAR|nr:hypothetical protein B0H16DRAFT_1466510 [Mycena metata]